MWTSIWYYILIISVLGILFIYIRHQSSGLGALGVGFRVAHKPKRSKKSLRAAEKDIEQEQMPFGKKAIEVEEETPDIDFTSKPLGNAEARDERGEVFEEVSSKVEPESETRQEEEDEDAPIDLVAILGEAMKELEAKKESNAERLFSKILGADYRHLEANQNLGIMYLKNGLASKAEPHFRLVTEVDGESAASWSNLGYALFLQDRFDEAKDVYKKSLEIDDTRPGRLASLAQVHVSLNEHAEAINLLDRATEMAPESIDFLFLLADTHDSVNNFDELFDVLEKILVLDTTNKEALRWREKASAKKQSIEDQNQASN